MDRESEFHEFHASTFYAYFAASLCLKFLYRPECESSTIFNVHRQIDQYSCRSPKVSNWRVNRESWPDREVSQCVVLQKNAKIHTQTGQEFRESQRDNSTCLPFASKHFAIRREPGAGASSRQFLVRPLWAVLNSSDGFEFTQLKLAFERSSRRASQ